MPPIKEHFENLMKLGEVRATKSIRTLVDGISGITTSNNDDCVYLPCSSGKRPMFYRYVKENGYAIKLLPRGKYEIKPIPGEEQKVPVSWTQYRRIWKRDYPKLKVNSPSEDICDMCVRFRNRHQYLASHTSNLATGHLDTIETEDIFGGSDSDEDNSVDKISGDAVQVPAAAIDEDNPVDKTTGDAVQVPAAAINPGAKPELHADAGKAETSTTVGATESPKKLSRKS